MATKTTKPLIKPCSLLSLSSTHDSSAVTYLTLPLQLRPFLFSNKTSKVTGAWKVAVEYQATTSTVDQHPSHRHYTEVAEEAWYLAVWRSTFLICTRSGRAWRKALEVWRAKCLQLSVRSPTPLRFVNCFLAVFYSADFCNVLDSFQFWNRLATAIFKRV